MPKRAKTRDPEINMIGKKFYFRGTIGGVRIDDKHLEASNFTEARLKKESLKLKYRSQGVDGNRLTLLHLKDEYLDERRSELKDGEIRSKTMRECEDIMRIYLVPFFGNTAIADIDEVPWGLFKKKYKGNDLPNIRKVLSHFLKWCRRNRYLKFVPELTVKQPKRRERVNLTEAEIIALFTKLTANVRVIAAMALFMGMRGSEITNLTWDRVDLENKVIFLRAEDTKTKKPRGVPINSEVLQMLLGLKEQADRRKRPSEFVFPNQRSPQRPMYPNSYGEQFERARVSAGIERYFTMHDLRATYEAYAHTTDGFTDAQREKMVGASVKVQKKTYLKLEADKIRGLEEVVKIPGLRLNHDKVGMDWGNKNGKRGQKPCK